MTPAWGWSEQVSSANAYMEMDPRFANFYPQICLFMRVHSTCRPTHTICISSLPKRLIELQQRKNLGAYRFVGVSTSETNDG